MLASRILRTGVPVIIGMALTGGTAWAQSWTLAGRFAFHINGAYQSGTRTLDETLAFDVYEDTGKLRITQDVVGGAIIDGGGLLRVWRELAVGVSYTQLNTSATASFEGTVPHPLVFDQRTVAPMELPSSYQERATHIHVAWVIPITTVEGLDVTISGGPTAFNLKRGAPEQVRVIETGVPFSDVRVEVEPGELRTNGWGGHVGADLVYMLRPRFGLGAFVRFTGGSVGTYSGSDGDSPTVGGFQSGGGLRFRF